MKTQSLYPHMHEAAEQGKDPYTVIIAQHWEMSYEEVEKLLKEGDVQARELREYLKTLYLGWQFL